MPTTEQDLKRNIQNSVLRHQAAQQLQKDPFAMAVKILELEDSLESLKNQLTKKEIRMKTKTYTKEITGVKALAIGLPIIFVALVCVVLIIAAALLIPILALPVAILLGILVGIIRLFKR